MTIQHRVCRSFPVLRHHAQDLNRESILNIFFAIDNSHITKADIIPVLWRIRSLTHKSCNQNTGWGFPVRMWMTVELVRMPNCHKATHRFSVDCFVVSHNCKSTESEKLFIIFMSSGILERWKQTYTPHPTPPPHWTFLYFTMLLPVK